MKPRLQLAFPASPLAPEPRTLVARVCQNTDCREVYDVTEWHGRDALPASVAGVHQGATPGLTWTVSHGICPRCAARAEGVPAREIA